MNTNMKWLYKKNLQKIFEIFLYETRQFYAVGGCVRNSILKKEITDIDFATDLLPNDIIRIAKENNIHYIPLSIKHGTIILVYKKISYHVSSFRSDILCDGRHANVKFTKEIFKDANRRDFTINALYLTKTGTIIDPLNGLSDLKAKNIRFIGNSNQRIREDYLRILRFFRFSAYYGDKKKELNKKALDACYHNRQNLVNISKERILDEIKKIILYKNPLKVLIEMEKIKILELIFNNYNLSNFSLLLKNEKKFFDKENFILRFFFLNVKNVNNCEYIFNQFPLKKIEKNIIKKLIKSFSQKCSNHEIGFRFGKEVGSTLLILKKSNSGNKVTFEELSQIDFGSKQIFPISGNDVLKFLPQSKELGEKMKFLEKLWIESGFTFTKESLLKFLI